MSDISIPGVTDTYKTNDLIASLMKLEKVPRDRAQETLDTYTAEQTAWRSVNRQMTSLRDNVRTLYSYNNPFNEKAAESSDPSALTADVTRDAAFETIKLNIQKVATADRFMSRELDRDYTVPSGNYVFSTGEKSVSLNWRGGKLQDFAAALNRRSNNTIRASIIGVSRNAQSLLVESLQQGKDNALTFSGAALDLALDAGIVEKSADEGTPFGLEPSEVTAVPGMNMRDTAISQGSITALPQSAFQLMLPEQARSGEAALVEFSLSTEAYTPPETGIDFTDDDGNGMEVPGTAGSADFKGMVIENRGSEAVMPEVPSPAVPEQSETMVFLRLQDGSEIPLEAVSSTGTVSEADTPSNPDTAARNSYTVDLSAYGSAESIVVRNTTQDKTAVLSDAFAYTNPAGSGYVPLNPVETAGDAEFTYQGIRITRGTNKVDDLIPGVTLNLHAPTEKPATLTIEPNLENSKEAIIAL
ncbi:MAG: flagellar filament capping protein FliD, partial [Spirochaetaceae bacterium]|nr:flagellar filament capping protein FliD [Spirochaetaceae bacterium]